MGHLNHIEIMREKTRKKMQDGFKVSEEGLRSIIAKHKEIGFSTEDSLALILNSLHKINHPKRG